MEYSQSNPRKLCLRAETSTMADFGLQNNRKHISSFSLYEGPKWSREKPWAVTAQLTYLQSQPSDNSPAWHLPYACQTGITDKCCFNSKKRKKKSGSPSRFWWVLNTIHLWAKNDRTQAMIFIKIRAPVNRTFSHYGHYLHCQMLSQILREENCVFW